MIHITYYISIKINILIYIYIQIEISLGVTGMHKKPKQDICSICDAHNTIYELIPFDPSIPPPSRGPYLDTCNSRICGHNQEQQAKQEPMLLKPRMALDFSPEMNEVSQNTKT